MAVNDDNDDDGELVLDLDNNNSWFLGLEGWLATKQWKLSCGFPAAAPFCRNNRVIRTLMIEITFRFWKTQFPYIDLVSNLN